MNDPKFHILDGRLHSRDSGLVPDDEPVFIFRARDVEAAATIRDYMCRVKGKDHAIAVHRRLVEFELFAAAHPDRMKQPDTNMLDGALPYFDFERKLAAADEAVGAQIKKAAGYKPKRTIWMVRMESGKEWTREGDRISAIDGELRIYDGETVIFQVAAGKWECFWVKS